MAVYTANAILTSQPATLSAVVTYYDNNIEVSFRTPQGVSLEVPIEASIAFTANAPIEASIVEPTIADPYLVIAAHAGQGIILLEWQHDNDDLVSYYELYASEDGVNYDEYQRGTFTKRHGIIQNVPLGIHAWFKIRAIGKNGAVGNFVNAVRGKLELPLVTMQVTSIKGSTIPDGSRFVSIDEETGTLIGIEAEGSINIQ